MKLFTNRVSQDDLAEAVAQAVDLEKQRLEQLTPEALDQVSGGVSITDLLQPSLPGSATAGMVPPTSPTFPTEPVLD